MGPRTICLVAVVYLSFPLLMVAPIRGEAPLPEDVLLAACGERAKLVSWDMEYVEHGRFGFTYRKRQIRDRQKSYEMRSVIIAGILPSGLMENPETQIFNGRERIEYSEKTGRARVSEAVGDYAIDGLLSQPFDWFKYFAEIRTNGISNGSEWLGLVTRVDRLTEYEEKVTLVFRGESPNGKFEVAVDFASEFGYYPSGYRTVYENRTFEQTDCELKWLVDENETKIVFPIRAIHKIYYQEDSPVTVEYEADLAKTRLNPRISDDQFSLAALPDHKNILDVDKMNERLRSSLSAAKNEDAIPPKGSARGRLGYILGGVAILAACVFLRRWMGR
jgi:hypothetical protein